MICVPWLQYLGKWHVLSKHKSSRLLVDKNHFLGWTS